MNDQASRAHRTRWFPLLTVLVLAVVAMAVTVKGSESADSPDAVAATDIRPPWPETGVYRFAYRGEAWRWETTTEITDISDDLPADERIELERNRVAVKVDSLTEEILIWDGPGSYYQESVHLDPDNGHRWSVQSLGAGDRAAHWQSGDSDPDLPQPSDASDGTLRGGVPIIYTDLDPKDPIIPQNLLGLVPLSSELSPDGKLMTYEYEAGEGEEGTVRIVGTFDVSRNVPISYVVFYGHRQTGTVDVTFRGLDSSSRAAIDMSNAGCLAFLDATKATRAELGLASC